MAIGVEPSMPDNRRLQLIAETHREIRQLQARAALLRAVGDAALVAARQLLQQNTWEADIPEPDDLVHIVSAQGKRVRVLLLPCFNGPVDGEAVVLNVMVDRAPARVSRDLLRLTGGGTCVAFGGPRRVFGLRWASGSLLRYVVHCKGGGEPIEQRYYEITSGGVIDEMPEDDYWYALRHRES